MSGNLLNFLWPTQGSYEDPSHEDDLAAIKKAEWVTEPEVFLEEARRLQDMETARKNTAGTKGHIYLGVLLALVSIMINIFELDFFKNALMNLESSSVIVFGLTIIAFGLMIAGISHVLAAFFYAFKTHKVEAYNRIDVSELMKYASSDRPKEELTRQILLFVRRDRITINKKVGLVKLAQHHIVRMAIMFICGILLLRLAPLVDFCSV